ncbi:MAG: cysteine hydrolase [Beijerinckiaceae bacterium]|nr:cysteine hydrolase [Beijerinckiaceae bacterium]
MKALIIVDMLNDFVTGVLPNESRALPIVPAIRRLIDHARKDPDWLVVYANDAHRADDREVSIWGRHAMAGTHGAMVIDALAPIGEEREIVTTKRFYGAFDDTDLEDTFIDYDVTDVVITGQHTDGAVRHTAYGAFFRGYGIQVPTDAVCVLGDGDSETALNYLVEMYGVVTTTSAALTGRQPLKTAYSKPGL